MPLNAHQIESLRILIQEKMGIAITSTKNYLLEARVVRVLQRLGLEDPDQLIASLQQGGQRAWEAMIFHVTTGHTYFLREIEHFDFLVVEIHRLGLQEPRIWVAASSSGEEVYSIAMILREAGISHFQILASDIHHENLLILKQGFYTGSRLKNVPKAWRLRYFNQATMDAYGEIRYQVNQEMRDHIKARKLNLLDDLRFESHFDFIFCRNVFMYFSRETQSKVLHMLLENLRPTGTLFMGQSENLLGIAEKLITPWPGVYQKKDQHEKETRSDH